MINFDLNLEKKRSKSRMTEIIFRNINYFNNYLLFSNKVVSCLTHSHSLTASQQHLTFLAKKDVKIFKQDIKSTDSENLVSECDGI